MSGRFVSADTMVTDPKNPQSLNRFSYVYNNPLKHIDPSGHCVKDDAVCLAYQKYLHDTYSIDLQDSLERAWTAYEAKLVYEAIYDIATKFSKEIPYKDSTELIKAAFGGTALMRNVGGLLFKRRATTLGKLIIFPDHSPENGLWETADEAWTKSVIVHELGHAWDNDEDLGGISQGLKSQVGKTSCMLIVICSYNPNAKGEAPVGTYANNGPHEDWAMSFAQYVEPYSGGHQPAWRNLGPLREQYVRVQIALLVTKEP